MLSCQNDFFLERWGLGQLRNRSATHCQLLGIPAFSGLRCRLGCTDWGRKRDSLFGCVCVCVLFLFRTGQLSELGTSERHQYCHVYALGANVWVSLIRPSAELSQEMGQEMGLNISTATTKPQDFPIGLYMGYMARGKPLGGG